MSTMQLMNVDTYLTTRCSNCAIVYALPDSFITQRKRDKKTFYCPNGHTQWYPGKTPEQELEAQLAQANRRVEREREWRREEARRAETIERSRRAVKGVATRRANELARVKNGVCPCCNRTFVALSAHMANQHPDYRPVAEVEAVTSVEMPPPSKATPR